MRLIIDTDAGIDDAEAIMMALTYPDVTVEAITTVTGNVHLDKVNRNVATVLQQVGKTVPVYGGADRPLVETWYNEESYHLNDGLGDWDARPPCEVTLEDEHAVMALIRLVNEAPNEITLVALAPLTNIALATRLDPTFLTKLKQFTFMGGAVDGHGNTPTVTAEFNIFIDPEAAYIVLNEIEQATMLSWETTVEHPIPMQDHERMCQLGTSLSTFYAGINDKVMKKFGNRAIGHWLPDPLAMAITLEPQLILETEKRHVTVELRGEHTRGQTVVNYTRYSKGRAKVDIVRKVNMQGVIRLYENMLTYVP